MRISALHSEYPVRSIPDSIRDSNEPGTSCPIHYQTRRIEEQNADDERCSRLPLSATPAETDSCEMHYRFLKAKSVPDRLTNLQVGILTTWGSTLPGCFRLWRDQDRFSKGKHR